ncbi:membrane protein of unknown function [Candidatus Promineifilum breve]|uniref:Uncharacterized protein n=1 Tax=Candidatus Promineifilum breve TaxID=1806508 RepID=A0A160T4J9_9CHLR|nr:hypothetical protein [Candidatus Promineifilum breve]CUS05016.2 membrane protein of unknown function [Candidatus Promineifilum breve]
MKQINYLFLTLLAFVVDAATFAATHLVLPWLGPIMQAPGGRGALILVAAFLLFVAGVFVFRRLEPTPGGTAEWPARPWRFGLAVAFALVAGLAFAWQLGFFASSSLVDTTKMGEGGSASYFVFGPGAWLALAMLYVPVFALRVNPAIQPTPALRYGAWSLVGLVATAVMVVVFTAQARAILLQTGAAWWWTIVALAVLIVMFGPPRLLFVSRALGLKSPFAYGVLVVFLMVLGVLATQMIITLM